MKIKIYKFLLSFIGKRLPKSNRTYFWGRLANKIRVSYARKISKGISKKATIEKGAQIAGGGIIVEPHGAIGVNCLVGGNTFIGEHTMMGPNVRIYTQNHRFDKEKRKFDGYEYKPVRIGKHCWIGDGAIILPGVTIGDGCIIGAGSVVTKSFGDYVLIAGNPAVVKKKLID